MKLTGVERAVVDQAKIRDYLLSGSHPVGRFKAPIFYRAGYSPEDWQVLADDLRQLAEDNDANATGSNRYGQKFEVRGSLKGPSGEPLSVVTVWIVLIGEDFPRLVTAYPRPRL